MAISTVKIRVRHVRRVEIDIKGENIPKYPPIYEAADKASGGNPVEGGKKFINPFVNQYMILKNRSPIILLFGYCVI